MTRHTAHAQTTYHIDLSSGADRDALTKLLNSLDAETSITMTLGRRHTPHTCDAATPRPSMTRSYAEAMRQVEATVYDAE